VKLPKRLAKLHAEAKALALSGRRLTFEEREFVFANFHEGAEHMNGLAGAFFTPPGLARDFALEVPECARVLDLCAGIGALADAVSDYKAREIVCVELNPAYVEVGRAVVPGATWVCASVFDVDAYAHLGPFDAVISNPPFGQVKADGFEGRYTGGLFEYRVIELASRLAPYGAFIVPQMSAPFRYSGQPYYRAEEDERARRFREQTGIVMQPNCGIDTATYRSDWRGVSPVCEIVCCDFSELDARADEPAQGALNFDEAAE
jgi:hypothetical protein